ncbi:MAG TPA: hypothetical protein VLM83_12125, partial [Anaerolineales bacterium]|nr:hypothetical protein [Anaerolineales bacterium]
MTSSHSSHRIALPAMLAVLGVAILIFMIALRGYLSSQPSAPEESTQTVESSPSPELQSDLASPTALTTQRPTWTPPPSPTTTNTRTVTPTLTRTIIPSLTPANPQAFDIRYRLVAWTLSEAGRMIELLTARAESEQSPEWFTAAAYAQQEALLRYPDAFEVPAWQWQYAYNLIQADSPLAAQAYADLIQSALVSGQVRPNELTTWFSNVEPRLTLITNPLPLQAGELNRSLIQISGSGSAFLWLIETPGSVQVYPLLDNFDPIVNSQSASLTTDLTGDGTDELVLYQVTSPGQTQFPDIWIFDLTQEPPTLMPTQPGLPLELGTESEHRISTTT